MERRKAVTCPHCDQPRRPGQAYCFAHHAAYQRITRTPHRLLPEPARRRANARAYANVYLRRGKLQRGPCEACGAPGAQMHHDDYDRPLDVRWFCRACHAALHRKTTTS